jgi:hypothetical protein
MLENLPFFLADTRVYSNTGKVALSQQLVELSGALSGFDEDDDLVELKRIEKVVELSVLFRLFELDGVLLQTVEGELGLIVDVDLEGVAHELLADRSDFLRQSGAEHHHLLAGRSGAEDLLDIATHVFCWLEERSPCRMVGLTDLIEHLVALVKDERLDAAEVENVVADKSVETTWSTNDDVGASLLVLDDFDILLNRSTAVEDAGLDVW